MEKVIVNCQVTSSLINVYEVDISRYIWLLVGDHSKFLKTANKPCRKFEVILKISIPIYCLVLSLTFVEKITEFSRSSQKLCPSWKYRRNFIYKRENLGFPKNWLEGPIHNSKPFTNSERPTFMSFQPIPKVERGKRTDPIDLLSLRRDVFWSQSPKDKMCDLPPAMCWFETKAGGRRHYALCPLLQPLLRLWYYFGNCTLLDISGW